MIPPNFRKLPVYKRKKILKEFYKLDQEEVDSLSNQVDLSDLADVLVESSIGTFSVPFGLATGFIIDRRLQLIPMATEEPSVIAAASYAARLVRAGSGFKTWADAPIMTTQIYLKDTCADAINFVHAHKESLGSQVDALIPRMVQRGGGFQAIKAEKVEDTTIISIDIDVRDAMGANVINTVAEQMKESLLELCGGTVLMAILTNSASRRKAGASFEAPAKLFKKGELSGEEVCQRIVEAATIASKFPDRAVTHNKGIMNGISALALATGNDTRSIEAGAHFYAQQTGSYQPLTSFSYESGILKGSIELPLSMGTVGGTTSIWPPSRLALKLLDLPDTQSLNRTAAAVGLAQNLAALLALVSDGIQGSHMKLHAARVAYSAGARGDEIRPLAAKLWDNESLDIEKAKRLLKEQSS